MAQFALTSRQIEDLRQLLQQRQHQLDATLSAELHADDDQSHTSVTAASDADWATADVDSDSLIAKAERDAGELAETNSALDKLAEGRYGVCETCGEAIGYQRLLAYPSARRCFACQKDVEARAGINQNR